MKKKKSFIVIKMDGTSLYREGYSKKDVQMNLADNVDVYDIVEVEEK